MGNNLGSSYYICAWPTLSDLVLAFFSILYYSTCGMLPTKTSTSKKSHLAFFLHCNGLWGAPPASALAIQMWSPWCSLQAVVPLGMQSCGQARSHLPSPHSREVMQWPCASLLYFQIENKWKFEKWCDLIWFGCHWERDTVHLGSPLVQFSHMSPSNMPSPFCCVF